jgi:formylglycine-generating enzyme required for sulfatase activity
LNEVPQHEVVITKPFYTSVYPVTVKQWKAFVTDAVYRTEADAQPNWRNPGFEQTDEHPVVCVSWFEAQLYCQWLTEKEGKQKEGMRYALPTEAQWEYSCRAGSRTRFHYGDDGEAQQLLTQYAWYIRNSVGKTHPVGLKKPNAWGLYDMIGNAMQWTSDWEKHDYYQECPREDPTGPIGSTGFRIVRGGCWSRPEQACRSAFRCGGQPFGRDTGTGFRVVLISQ